MLSIIPYVTYQATLLWRLHRTFVGSHSIIKPDFEASFQAHIRITVYGAIIIYDYLSYKYYSLVFCSVCPIHWFSWLLSIHWLFEYFFCSHLEAIVISSFHLVEVIILWCLQQLLCSMFLQVDSRNSLTIYYLGPLLILITFKYIEWKSFLRYLE